MRLKIFSTVLLVGAASLATARASQASEIVLVQAIDDFTVTESNFLGSGTTTFDPVTLPPTSSPFEQRQVTLDVVVENPPDKFYRYEIGNLSSIVEVSSDSGVQGVTIIEYTLPFGGTVDLTSDAGFIGLSIPFTESTFDYSIEFQDLDGDVGVVNGSSPVSAPPEEVDLFAFSKFTDIDFNEVTAAALVVNSGADIDLQIDFFGTASHQVSDPTVPEPTSLVVLGLGALGAFGVRRRLKA